MTPTAAPEATEVPAAVSVRGVSKTFPGQKALDDVSFDVAPSSIHALLGHNGSGKSTLIKVMAGLYGPDRGSRIDLDGQALALGSPRESARRGLRFVHQDLGLISELSASENMALTWGYARGVGRRIDWKVHERNVLAALERLQVAVDIRRPVGQLRAVERTAVAIARALGEPDSSIGVLVLDEPTAALPPGEVDSLFEILRDIRAQGVSILYVSHRLGEILALADAASVLRDGVLQGTVELADMDRAALVEMIVGEIDGDEAPPGQHGDGRRNPFRPSDPESSLMFAVKVSSRAVHGLELSLHAGEILGVAGLAGSGRDELCEAIVGATASEVEIRDVSTGVEHRRMNPTRARRLGIGLVLPNRDHRSAIKPFSVSENVSLASLANASKWGVLRGKKESELARGWVRRLDIRPGDPAQLYAYLSGGNQQKTVFAKWLSISPRALLLEDPTTGVDVGARSLIYSLIEQQADAGLTVLVASSDVEDLVALCDRVIVISNGKVVEEVLGSDITETKLLQSLTRMDAEVSEESRAGAA